MYESIEGALFKQIPGCSSEGKWEKHKLKPDVSGVWELHRRSDLVEISDVGHSKSSSLGLLSLVSSVFLCRDKKPCVLVGVRGFYNKYSFISFVLLRSQLSAIEKIENGEDCQHGTYTAGGLDRWSG
ncbi:hypothetical protein Tco_0794195 [Tanacetum coccineum]